MNTDILSFIPKYKGIENSTINGYTRNPGGNPQSNNPFHPQLYPFSFKAKATASTPTPGQPNYATNFILTYPQINLYRHSNNFNSAHTNFKINAVLRHKDIKQQSVEILGGICINSSDGDNENDIFELDYTYTQSQSNPDVTSLIDIKHPTKPFIEPYIQVNDDIEGGGVYNSYNLAFDDGSSPHLIIILRFSYYYQNLTTTLFPLINGIITFI
tara:strand:+ start:1399 stop:2040 length:642 start_codon:yes stop_codon:yes gene_type:complete